MKKSSQIFSEKTFNIFLYFHLNAQIENNCVNPSPTRSRLSGYCTWAIRLWNYCILEWKMQ